MRDNIHYLHGVIDTLTHIINNNTNIRINLNLPITEYNDTILDDIIIDNNISDIDTAKNYIQLMEKARTNREQLLCKTEISTYISHLQKSIKETIEKLKARKLDEKRINNLIRNNFLKPIDCKLLLDYKYESVSLTQEDISYLRDCNNKRYRYSKYKIFDKEKFINSFLNYTISIFDINDMINTIVNNSFCNIKYIQQKTSKSEDPFSFYYITKIEEDKIHWTMDNRLIDISNDIRFSCIEYCINLFRKIYIDIFHDNDYRQHFERDKEILEFECMHLIKNIKVLSNEIEFNKLFQKILINASNTEFPNFDKFKLNLKGDDSTFKNYYKEIQENNEFQENIYKLFDNMIEEIFDGLINKIEII